VEGLVVGEGVEMMSYVVLHHFGDVDVLVEHVHGDLQTEYGKATPGEGRCMRSDTEDAYGLKPIRAQ
jgi:hypothetical protein